MQPSDAQRQAERLASSSLGTNISVEEIVQKQFESVLVEPYENKDYKGLLRQLARFLMYPSDQLAEKHIEVSRLSKGDLGDLTPDNRCDCCDRPHYSGDDNKLLPFFTSINSLKRLGAAVPIFFNDILMMSLLMLVTFIIYGIYGVVTNYKFGGSQNLQQCYGSDSCTVASLFSVNAKLNDPNGEYDRYYMYESCIGLGLMVIWYVLLELNHYYYKKWEQQEDQRSKTASDFTLLIRNLPTSVRKANLEVFFREILAKNMNEGNDSASTELLKNLDDLKVLRYTVGMFNSNQIQDIYDKNEQYIESRKKIRKQKEEAFRSIMERIIQLGAVPDELDREGKTKFREYIYASHEVSIEINKLHQQVSSKTRQAVHKSGYNRYVFVTLNNQKYRRAIEKLHQVGWEFLCIKQSKNLPLAQKVPNVTKVERAPQPEEILWDNIHITSTQRRKNQIITYVGTVLLLAVSFGVYLGFQYIENTFSYTVVSWAKGQIVNLLSMGIEKLIDILSEKERHYLLAYQEAGSAKKGLIATVFNEIVLIIIVARVIKNNMFQATGLANDVFWIAVGVHTSVIMRMINMGFWWRVLKRWWYTSKPTRRLFFGTQEEYNEMVQKPDFSVANEYGQVIKMVIFSAFFMSLQPWVSLVTSIGLLLIYASEKFALFYTCSRPLPISSTLSNQLRRFQYFAIVAYGIGSLLWPLLLDRPYTVSLAPNIVCIVMGVIMMIAPTWGLKPEQKESPKHDAEYQTLKSSLVTDYFKQDEVKQTGIKANSKMTSLNYQVLQKFEGDLRNLENLAVYSISQQSSQASLLWDSGLQAAQQKSTDPYVKERNDWKKRLHSQIGTCQYILKSQLEAFQNNINELKSNTKVNMDLIKKRVGELKNMKETFNNKFIDEHRKYFNRVREVYKKQKEASPAPSAQRLQAIEKELADFAKEEQKVNEFYKDISKKLQSERMEEEIQAKPEKLQEMEKGVQVKDVDIQIQNSLAPNMKMEQSLKSLQSLKFKFTTKGHRLDQGSLGGVHCIQVDDF